MVAGKAAPKPGAARKSGIEPASVPPVDVAIDALRQPRPEPAEVGAEPVPVRAEGGAAAAARGSRQPASAAAQGSATLPPTPPGPPPLPPIPLKFIGIVEEPEQHRKLAVLSDGRFTYYGREGDIIEGRYRIVRIGVESIEMVHVDGRGAQTIRLSGS